MADCVKNEEIQKPAPVGHETQVLACDNGHKSSMQWLKTISAMLMLTAFSVRAEGDTLGNKNAALIQDATGKVPKRTVLLCWVSG